jgi:hypothetical protein
MHRVDMLCDNDEAAEARAKLLIDIHIVELWQGTRKVATFPVTH